MFQELPSGQFVVTLPVPFGSPRGFPLAVLARALKERGFSKDMKLDTGNAVACQFLTFLCASTCEQLP